jgi:hypothetical protein
VVEIVQPFTVTTVAEAPDPRGMLVELETDPPPAWTCTDEPPAELLLDRPPPAELVTELPVPAELVDPTELPAEDELIVPPPEAPVAVMLPSAFLLTVTVQVWPAAFLPCLVIVSASAAVPPAQATATASTMAVLCVMACLPKRERGGHEGRPERGCAYLVPAAEPPVPTVEEDVPPPADEPPVPTVEAEPVPEPVPAAEPPVPIVEDEVPLPAEEPPVPTVEAEPVPEPEPAAEPPAPTVDDESPPLRSL